MSTRNTPTPALKARANSRYIHRALSVYKINRSVSRDLELSSTYLNRPAIFVNRSFSVETPLAEARPVVIPFVETMPAVAQLVEIQPMALLTANTASTENIEQAETSETKNTRRKLALLLPGHNEELIIATTIHSAVAAGQDIRDIFVVNDASTDATRKIATELLGKKNVMNVQRSGKALAVKKAIKKFNIEQDYEWLHIADADSVFSPNYFNIFREKLTDDYVVAIGFVQSLRGNWISTYRAFSYTYGQHVFRRIQSALGMISVFPGPVTSFRTDILSKLDINGNNVTEDFDITLQVHRKKLGKIVFIPKAISYTQDPQSLRDFCKQSMRWYTGFFQGIQDYEIGRHKQRIDIGIGFQLLQTAFFLVQILVLFPLVMIQTHHWIAIPIAMSIDFILTSALTFLSAIAIKRWTLIGVLPYFYFLRIAELIMYFTAFFQVVVLKRYESGINGWSTEGRRYKIASAALSDAA